MKLRIHDNTLRIRLTQSEVARLAAGNPVEQITEFAPTSFLITLVKPSSQVRSTTATFQDNQLSVLLPLDAVTRWAHSDQVGIEASQTIGSALRCRRQHRCVSQSPIGLNPDLVIPGGQMDPGIAIPGLFGGELNRCPFLCLLARDGNIAPVEAFTHSGASGDSRKTIGRGDACVQCGGHRRQNP